MKGYITSIDPMSFTSGPGIRVSIKLDEESVIELTPNETVNRIRKFRPYIGPDNGGVTFSGTMLFRQTDFIKETCLISHKAGINTCIETSGYDYEEDLDLFKHIDLVIIGIDSLPLYNYNNIEVEKLMNLNKLINNLEELKKDIWIKQIIRKDINDNEEYISTLKKFLGMYSNIKDIELIAHDVDSNELKRLEQILMEV